MSIRKCDNSGVKTRHSVCEVVCCVWGYTRVWMDVDHVDRDDRRIGGMTDRHCSSARGSGTLTVEFGFWPIAHSNNIEIIV